MSSSPGPARAATVEVAAEPLANASPNCAPSRAAIARSRRARVEEAPADRLEALELRPLLLRHEVEDVVQGARGIPLRAVQGHLDKAACLEAVQGPVCLHAVHPRRPRDLPCGRRARAGQVHEDDRLVPPEAETLEGVHRIRDSHLDSGRRRGRINYVRNAELLQRRAASPP